MYKQNVTIFIVKHLREVRAIYTTALYCTLNIYSFLLFVLFFAIYTIVVLYVVVVLYVLPRRTNRSSTPNFVLCKYNDNKGFSILFYSKNIYTGGLFPCALWHRVTHLLMRYMSGRHTLLGGIRSTSMSSYSFGSQESR